MTTPRKLTLDDLWTFKIMGYIAFSPNGRRVAFVMHSTDKAKNEQQSAIWLLQLNEQGLAVGEPRQLTSGVKNDTQPAWAPDSRHLLFISDREGEKSQLWLIDTDGGEAGDARGQHVPRSPAACGPTGPSARRAQARRSSPHARGSPRARRATAARPRPDSLRTRRRR